MSTCSPVVACTSSVFGHVEVLWVVEVSVESVLDAIDDSRLQVDQQGSGDVMFIVSLVEEHIFPVVVVGGVLLQNSVWLNSVFVAELLPELVTDWRVRLKAYFGSRTILLGA
jgi:hypothetical protein